MADDAAAAGQLLAVPAVNPDLAVALLRLRYRIDTGPETRPAVWYERVIDMVKLQRRQLIRPLGGVAAAAAVAGALVFTPAGALAGKALTIFEPQQIAVVPINPGDLRSLPDLADYGTMTMGPTPTAQHVADLNAASAAAGIPVLQAGSLPAGLPGAASYEVLPGSSASFTFSAAKAKAAAAAKSQTLPAMPANIDGSTLHLSTNPAVVTVYGAGSSLLGLNGGSAGQAKEVAGAGQTSAGAAGELRHPGGAGTSSASGQPAGPVLIIGQMKAPVVTSTGVTVTDLETYLLSQPGISPQLVSAIKSIGDPTSTMPIPVPVNMAAAHPIQVHGVSGLSLADSTGIGGGIIWEQNGVIYGVAGTFTEQQLLAAANSLH